VTWGVVGRHKSAGHAFDGMTRPCNSPAPCGYCGFSSRPVCHSVNGCVQFFEIAQLIEFRELIFSETPYAAFLETRLEHVLWFWLDAILWLIFGLLDARGLLSRKWAAIARTASSQPILNDIEQR
jgi:hypothetical protein